MEVEISWLGICFPDLADTKTFTIYLALYLANCILDFKVYLTNFPKLKIDTKEDVKNSYSKLVAYFQAIFLFFRLFGFVGIFLKFLSFTKYISFEQDSLFESTK
uniref:Uncharacterized protein n=1 Tax=Acrobeloides nanus TaxID=290746 RepID=A0A914DCA6_9BILA